MTIVTKPTTTPTAAPFAIVPGKVATAGLRFLRRTSTLGVTVHCSASKPSQNWGAAEVDRMHRNQGWLCIGYHFVIRRDGTVESGRPVDVQGSHCRDGGRNKTHIGICLIGGIGENPVKHTPGNPWNGSDAECNFTPAQMRSLTFLIEKLKWGFKSILSVEGHRDVPGVRKACPSFQVGHWAQTGELKL
jgi:N-acetyl-anhydromuramyl-L-alanine amidase AmpD